MNAAQRRNRRRIRTSLCEAENPEPAPVATHRGLPDARSGVALIMVLGLLAIMTILCVAFAISMRVERVAARYYAEDTRTQHLMDVAMVRALRRANQIMVGGAQAYPDFSSQPNSRPDILVSNASSDPAPDLLVGEALDYIPDALQPEARLASPQWDTNSIPNGRVAWFLINASGLLDANIADEPAVPRRAGLSIREIDLNGTPDIANIAQFQSDRAQHVRYETVAELRNQNSGINAVENLFTFSYDPNPDEFFTALPPPNLGTIAAAANLLPKFRVNDITNYAGYTDPTPDAFINDPAFMNAYFNPLVSLLSSYAGLPQTPGAEQKLAWNLVNYLDEDRVPQNDSPQPWKNAWGVENTPMINEIVFEEVASSNYQFAIELWYPFSGSDVDPNDGFRLEVSVFTNAVATDLQAPAVSEINVTGQQHTPWSWVYPITNMTYGTPTEFLVSRGPAMTLSPGSSLGDPNNTIRMLARVIQNVGGVDYIVDESMGYESNGSQWLLGGNAFTEGYSLGALFKYTAPQGFSVRDPRQNCVIRNWINFPAIIYKLGGRHYPVPNHTLGAINTATTPFDPALQGLPIYHRNGPMQNIGELGHLYRSDLTGNNSPPANQALWRSIDIMKRDEGARLLEILTARTNSVVHSYGRVNISTAQDGVLRALFNNLQIGEPDWTPIGPLALNPADIDDLIDALINNGPYRGFRDLFSNPAVGDAFAACAPNGINSSDLYREATFRAICEMLTFRQNIFLVIGIAQTIASDGNTVTVMAEKRAVATICRDAYTGRHFKRSFKWLDD